MANRQQKYPITDTFRYHNANIKGRVTTDCVIRAICTALNQTWENTLMEMVELSIKTGYMLDDKKTIELYLASKGYAKQRQLKHLNGKKYTGKEFCKEYNEGTYLIMIGGHHISVVIEGRVHDIWDCTDNCVGNYWVIK